MQAADLSPVPVAGRTQSGWDLFLLFAAANIVATTMQVGASLVASLVVRGRLWGLISCHHTTAHPVPARWFSTYRKES